MTYTQWVPELKTSFNDDRGVCVFITAVPIAKLFAFGGGDIGGHVLRETTRKRVRGLLRNTGPSGPQAAPRTSGTDTAVRAL